MKYRRDFAKFQIIQLSISIVICKTNIVIQFSKTN